MIHVTKIIDEGNLEISNRIVIQFSDIFQSNFILMSKEDETNFLRELFECQIGLIAVEKSIKQYREMLARISHSVNSQKDEIIRGNALHYDDYTAELLKCFKEVLVDLVVILRRTITLAEISFQRKFKKPDDLLKYIKKIIDNSNTDEWLDIESKKQIELYEIRGLFEHPPVGGIESRITRYYLFLNNNELIINFPRLVKEGVGLLEYMELAFSCVVDFCENFAALLLSRNCREGTCIVCCTIDKQKEKPGYHYQVSFTPEVLAKINL